MAPRLTESDVEEIVLGWFGELGYSVLHGPAIASGEPGAERYDYSNPLLPDRLKSALSRLNPSLPLETLEEAFRKLSRLDSPSLIQQNRLFHKMLVEGIPVEYRLGDRIVHDLAKLADWENPKNNDWVVVSQFTVVENHHNRRPDIVVFLNGLPVAVIELKNPTDENATIWGAFDQLETYKSEIPALFTTNEVMVISDGIHAKVGSLTANKEWFMPWRTIEGEELAPTRLTPLEILTRGVFEKSRFLSYLRHFVVFEEDTGGLPVKKIAGYHQFHAVNKAVLETVTATRPLGDRRVGVVWHTQGSGKSLTMVFYAGKIVLHPAMANPTLVVLTDRNDLDQQLFGTFSRCNELLRQTPVQADTRAKLRELLNVASGGIVFTTIQKFLPEQKGDTFPTLSDRRNIIVIADEAHRSQYDFIDGYARHMRDALPNASFVGFTGTPVELNDRNTQAIFGDYISVYDIQRAVDDGATVPIYYESRLARLELPEEEKPHLDQTFEELTEAEEEEHKEKLKSKWAALEAVVGSEKRIHLIARDMVDHFEERQKALEGKAMIVCMSRRICVDLYNELILLRPEWGDTDDTKGTLKIVMTGSASDPLEWQNHIRTKARREALAKQFRDPNNPFKIVIVRDMWLTGFDAPSLHTMYLDKPMQGHGLMQTIARVNRVFRNKPGGLIVDYLGLADQLRRAMATYTESRGKGQLTLDQDDAVAALMKHYEICRGLFHGFARSVWKSGTPEKRYALLPQAQEHILAQEDGKSRLAKAVNDLSKAFALATPHLKALAIRDDVGFFQAVKAALIKRTDSERPDQDGMEQAIRQVVSGAIVSEGVIDLFSAAGIKRPDVSILSDEFLAEIRGMPQKNLAIELLRKLLAEGIKTRSRKNTVQARTFSELLEKSLRAYHNRAIETVEVIEELIKLAKEIRTAERRGQDLGLTEDEVAFYDALETSDSAVKVLGDETLKKIARELVQEVRASVTIDWKDRENVRAAIRVKIKKILRKYGYPPDKREKAIQTVMEQAETLCGEWVA
uniref:Type I restriction enzyme endonuclease subunit n=1 Tax=Leptospirillum ferrodiazotrophum TaxID=412449 RepID=C6I093_9BACT|nr:MAG: type I site-specific deoxyribonuclease, HsdR family [Leptospirillum ferrodiazotrophum]